MIPLAPVPFATLGTLCYGELYLGLCRALAAPWLDPWWLTEAHSKQIQHCRLGWARTIGGTAIEDGFA
jgi:hypothetical protein